VFTHFVRAAQKRTQALRAWWSSQPPQAPRAPRRCLARDLKHVRLMPIPLQVTLRGLEPSETIDQLIRDRVSRLERFYERVVSCHVVVEAPTQHKHKGGSFRVSVKLTVPGAEIAIARDPGKNHGHEDFRVALRDAFSAAVRKLEDHARVRRGDVKTHAPARVPA